MLRDTPPGVIEGHDQRSLHLFKWVLKMRNERDLIRMARGRMSTLN